MSTAAAAAAPNPRIQAARVCAVAGCLGRAGDIATMPDHLDYMIRRFGADHVAIATDLAYVSRNSDAEYRKLPARRRSRPSWESLWPNDSYPRAQSPSLAWTNWPLFTVGLVQRGHSDDDIRKVIGGNALRVARAAMG
jgi:membrane dipeptidase